MILPCILYAHHIADVFYHTDRTLVTGTVRADCTDIIVRDHHTVSAVLDVISEMVNSCCEMMHILLRLLEQMQGQTQGAAAAYAGKRADCVHGFFKQFGRVFFFICHNL